MLQKIKADNQPAFVLVGVKRLELPTSLPLAVPKIVCSLFASHNFDRCAISASLYPPQAAVGFNAQSRYPALLAGCCKKIKADIPSALTVVGVKRLELPTSCSQSRRATNCATPRDIKLYLLFYIDITVRRATNYRSEILSHCSLGALRIALYFFLLMPLPSSATGGGKVSATTPRTYLNNEDYYIKLKG